MVVPTLILAIAASYLVFYVVSEWLEYIMPRGTVAQNTERYDLKTLPPDGFVVIRRMTFGEKLAHQDDALHMQSTGVGKNSSLELKSMFRKMALTDFGNLVVDHNITDDQDRLLNFKSAQDVLALDPRVGDEISQLIDALNTYEDTEELKK